jgi:hypothetical protein
VKEAHIHGYMYVAFTVKLVESVTLHLLYFEQKLFIIFILIISCYTMPYVPPLTHRCVVQDVAVYCEVHRASIYHVPSWEQ